MIGDIDWFTRIVGGVADGDNAANGKIAKALIRSGLAVVLIEPNGKKAVCTLTARDAKKADIAAQDTARVAGSPNWEKIRHDCGIKHALTDEKILVRSRIKYWINEGCNLAIAPGASEKRVLIVDVDTEEERRSFLDDWSKAQGDDEITAYPMTVSSPGTMNATVDEQDVWVHKNGGHYWFDIPDGVELPERPGKMTWCSCHQTRQPQGTCPRAWVAYYGSGYVLIPPSVRREGAYRLTGSVHTAPGWLTDLIQGNATKRPDEDGTGALSRFSDDPIDEWSARTSWYDILTEDGYTPHDHDNCGCPTFTRPGASNPKSVTGHEFGCSQYDTSMGHGPLHIWSDALGGGTLSKLSYVARERYGGNIPAAMEALHIGKLSAVEELEPLGEDDLDDLGDAPKANAPEHGAEHKEDRFAPIDWDELFAEEFNTADFLPGMLLERGQQIALIGDGKSGKSLVMAEWCIKVIEGLSFLVNDVTTDPLTVMYLDAENSRRDLIMRVRSLGGRLEALRERLVYLSFPPFKPLDSDDGARQVMALVNKYQPDIVILDTVSRFIQGKENDSDTWLALYRVLHKRLKARNICGIRLDHFGKDAEKGGRGSSAKSQDIDHVWELKAGEEEITVRNGGIEVVTFMELKRTHTRTGLGPDRISIKRRGVKTLDEKEWLPGETSHEIADVFDSVTVLDDVPIPRPIEIMRAVCEMLDGMDSGTPLREIRGAIKAKATIVDEAIRLLIEEGYVKKEIKGRSHLHTLIKMIPEEMS